MITFFIIIFFTVGVFALIATGLLFGEDDYGQGFATLFCALVVMFVSIFIWSSEWGQHKYKEGQVDALTGEINYELKTNKDSTRVWIKKDNGE